MTIDEMNRRRRELGYSYAKLSDLSGVPVPTIQKVLSGTTTSPRYETIHALESVLTIYHTEHLSENTVRETAIDYSVKYPYDRQGTYTIADRDTIPDEFRTELIDGVIYDMASPGFFHQQAAGIAYYQINSFIRRRGGECIPMIAPMDVQLDRDEKTMVQPDVFIICDREQITQRMICGAPAFVMEIILPSTSRKDYTKKVAKYEQAGVREYWIVDPYQRRIFVYFFESADRCPAVYSIEDPVSVNIYDGELTIDFKDILQWLPKNEENTDSE